MTRALRLVVPLLLSCGVSRQGHEPIQYPELEIQSRGIDVQVLDSRPEGPTPPSRRLSLPTDFEAVARARLTRLVAGSGPELQLLVQLGAADQIELVDARGEVTRVAVTLNFELKVPGGPLLRAAQSQSSSDMPRDEVTPEEVESVLRVTAIDAFDRYWANPETLTRINRDLAAYGQKHPIATPSLLPASGARQ